MAAREDVGSKTSVIGIVIVAHGGLAPEYLRAIEHVVGVQQGIRAIVIEGDHSPRTGCRASKPNSTCRFAHRVPA